VETLAAMKSGMREWDWGDVRSASSVSGFGYGRGFRVGFEHGFDGQDEAQGMSHAGMPGSGAGHLRSVVGNDDAIEVIAVEDGEDADHVHVAFVDESLLVMGYFAPDVAKVQVSDLALLAVTIHGVVNIASGHLGERAHAQFERVAWTGNQIEQALVQMGLIDKPRLLPQGRQGWIVGMRCEAHPRLLGHRQDLFQKPLQPPPKLIARDRTQAAWRRIPVINHVPDASVRNRIVERSIHADGDRAAAPVGSTCSPADPGQAEVVSEDGNPRFAHSPDDGLDVLRVLGTLGAVEKNVIPVSGVEILDRRQHEPGTFDFRADSLQLMCGPQPVRIAGKPPVDRARP
jgi:hypothetical protein